MKVERLSIESLIPDPVNARKHDNKNLDAIKGSLTKYGQQKPIVINTKNIVLAGNGTLAAAKALGWTEIDVVRSNLTGSDATGFSLADNRTAELAAWDNDVLGSLLSSLADEDYDLASIGFDANFLAGSSVDSMLDQITNDDLDDKPLPEPKYNLTVQFDNDTDQQDLFIELRDRGFKVKV